MDSNVKERLEDIYRRLFRCYGPQRWWPGEEPFEVMVGAVLTQSVAWKNVEKAITNLKTTNVMSPATLRSIPLQELAELIHPTIYFNQKARKLKALVEWFQASCDDSLEVMCEKETFALRTELLFVWGIGEETADSIVLYAAEKPLFVIDAYTRRILDRIGVTPDGNKYSDYQALFMRNLPLDVSMFNEYHALFVRLGKDICRPKPLCDQCCLKEICDTGLS